MNPGKVLVVIGLSIASVGLVVWLAGDRIRLFRLPGDIVTERPGFGLYIPIVSMLLLGVVASAIAFIFRMLSR